MLRYEYPQFSFSHKISYEKSEFALSNDLGADLVCRDKAVQTILLIKHKKSKNMMDSFSLDISRSFDAGSLFKTVTEVCACFEERVELPKEKMPVVLLLSPEVLMWKFFSDLDGLAMGTGASIFSRKMGQKLFSDSFSLCVKRNPRDDFRCFFDAEGTVLPNDSFALIENGVLKSPYSSRKIAQEYGYDASGSAGGVFDSVPATSWDSISIKPGSQTIEELLGGRKAVYVVIANGGDFTPQGEYASPVQSAFLFDGRNLLGRLPQLVISSDLYSMFGKDFIGMSVQGRSPHSPFKYLVMEMDVSRIGDWI
jgi:PmbA protein